MMNGKKALLTRTMGRCIPFSVDKKPLNKKVILSDGVTGLHYRSYDPISDFDSKVLHIISKLCMDAELHNDESLCMDMIKVHKKYDETPFYGVTVLLHGMARYINPQNKDTLQYRERIYDSLIRLSGVTIYVHEDMVKDKLFKRPTGAMGWINGVKLVGNYDKVEEVDLWISKDLMIGLTNGLSFNLDHALQFKGRAYFLNNFMQTYRYEISKNKYGYQNHISHDEIVAALNLGNYKVERRVKSEIRKAFKEIGLNYEYYITKEKKATWKKGKFKAALNLRVDNSPT